MPTVTGRMPNVNRIGLRVFRLRLKTSWGAYKNLQAQLSGELQEEFEGTPTKKRLFRTKWRGYLDMESLSIRFGKPFTQGEATVPDAFKNVLRDFFSAVRRDPDEARI